VDAGRWAAEGKSCGDDKRFLRADESFELNTRRRRLIFKGFGDFFHRRMVAVGLEKMR
jgi:hypothetical protein